MSIKEAKTCPRKAYLRSQVPSGVKKASVLRKVAKDVLLAVPLSCTSAQLKAAVDAAFAGLSEKMLGFELEAERFRMKILLDRYLTFEQTQPSKNVLAQDFRNKVKVMGTEHEISAHRLIDRGTALECVRYLYKAPVESYQSRTASFRPEKNPDLLALQRCGEAEAAKLGINKPVFGAFYYLKSKMDRSRQLDPAFESSLGANIVNHHFTPGEETALENDFKGIKEDPSVCCDDPRTCYDCVFSDLCHTEFDKRKLAELPAVEETALDSIHMTPNQQEFVAFDVGQCRVNAVAGSGKTTIVTLRTLRLIEDGCPPGDILMVTFTDKAKGEMRNRLRRYAKGAALKDLNIDTDKIDVETFNSFGQKFLEQHYSKLGFSKSPELVDEVLKKDILVGLLEAHQNLPFDYRNPFLNLPNASGAVVQLGHIVDAMKANHVQTVDDAKPFLAADLHRHIPELLDIYNEYNAELVRNNCIDYEDQLRLLLQLKQFGVFETLPYQHIVVDEFQDSDMNQINLILEMSASAKKLRSIVVVGDEMQAIYGFRNANPDNLVSFGKYFPGMIDIPLEDNFRSQSPIIEMANRILAREARIAKVIRAHRTENGIDPVLKPVEDLETERDLFVRQVEKLIKNGTPPKDIAILCRTKSELLGHQKALDALGIPTILRVPEVVGEAPYTKAVIALAAFLLDHNNLIDFALYRKSLGYDPFDAEAIQVEAAALGKQWDGLQTEQERILLFTALVKDATEDYIGKSFVESILTKGFHTARSMLEFCVKYREYGIKETQSTAREDADAVTLITVHSAKGLEWPVVLLSLRKFKPASEEEHRLLYVAVTRAKEKLLVTYPKKQTTLVSLLR